MKPRGIKCTQNRSQHNDYSMSIITDICFGTFYDLFTKTRIKRNQTQQQTKSSLTLERNSSSIVVKIGHITWVRLLPSSPSPKSSSAVDELFFRVSSARSVPSL